MAALRPVEADPASKKLNNQPINIQTRKPIKVIITSLKQDASHHEGQGAACPGSKDSESLKPLKWQDFRNGPGDTMAAPATHKGSPCSQHTEHPCQPENLAATVTVPEGEMQATMRARALPPKESISSLVSLESRYGMWGTADAPADSRSARAEITCHSGLACLSVF